MKSFKGLGLRFKRNIRGSVLILIIILMVLNFFWVYPSTNIISYESNDIDNLKSSATRIIQQQWLNNSDFSSQADWFFAKGSQGDNSSVDANISNGYANYKILGDRESFSLLSGIVNSSSWFGWDIYNNSDYLLPDLAEINTAGCYVYHYLDESEGPTDEGQVHNYPSVHFKKNVSLSEDLSNFEISSATLDVIFNASVGSNVDAPGDTVGQSAIWDSATFYVEITDLENSYAFRVAEYKTTTLGQDSPPILTINDTHLTSISQGDLITAINLALEKDPSHSNFTIIMGLDIYCEDNDFPDYDLWNYLIFKSFNFTFEYESKIEQFSSVSWNQIGDKIEGADIQILNATMNFDYMIDSIWPTALSPFSEIRMIINNNRYSETIKLGDANLTFNQAKLGGFDITSLISKGVNISVSLQVFVANTFGLGQNITLSIDNVFLNVTLIETFPDIESKLSLFLNKENKTTELYIEIPKNQQINITVKYFDELGFHISGAQIRLEGAGFVEDLIENQTLQQYTAIINSTEKLILGNNMLTISAQKTNYITKVLNPSISVRKINTEFSTLTGNDTINLTPGENVEIRVKLNDTDYNKLISGAVVLYSWSFGQGTLTDSDNDGIYEGIIRNVPEGSYNIKITAYGIEDYNFEDYEIILNAVSSQVPDWTWLIILLSCVAVGLVIVISLYQFHFKYPPMVRKIRKLKKKIKKSKNTKTIIVSQREDIAIINFNDYKKVLGLEIIELKNIEKVPKKNEVKE